MIEGFAAGGVIRRFSQGAAIVAATLMLVGCGRSAPAPGAADATGQAATPSGNPGAPGSATAGPRRDAASSAAATGAGGATGAAGGGSVAATVARLEQVLTDTSDAFFEGDVERLGQSVGSVREALRQLQALLPRAKIDPERSRTATKAVADLSACCSQAEARMRSGKEVEQAEMQAFAQRVEAALGSLKASTDGVP